VYPPPALRTSNVEFLGTTAGIVLVAVVAVLGLAIFIGMVYWADSHPDPRIIENRRTRMERGTRTYMEMSEELPRGPG
jgi:hypothetical protein